MIAPLVGNLIMSGFDGPELSARTRSALLRSERAGVILFSRNLPSTDETVQLTASIARTANDLPLLIAVDEEGGRVSRLPRGESRLPPMRLLGQIGDEELCRRAGRSLGARLLTLGFNYNFAPILDVDSNPNNPVIGDRSFSSSATEVARLGCAFFSGLQSSGVLSCGKHFPGHGDTDTDSHFQLPRLTHARATLEGREWVPFRRASAEGIDSIMSAHVVMSALDTLPATLSSRAMTDLLRGELGFKGVLVSDDLEMKAILNDYETDASAVLAVAAGCDLLLVCKDEGNAERAFESLVREAEKSPAMRARVTEAALRVTAMRSRLRPDIGRKVGEPLNQIVQEIEQRAGRPS